MVVLKRQRLRSGNTLGILLRSFIVQSIARLCLNEQLQAKGGGRLKDM